MFSMALLGEPPSDVVEVPLPRLDPVDDNYITLFETVCEALQGWGTLQFAVSGFGDPSWAVDIRTDFAIVMEQLPDLARWLQSRQHEGGELDFFEQGVERRIDLARVGGDEVVMTMTSRLLPGEHPRETISAIELQCQLERLTRRFFDLATLASPDCMRHPWMQSHFAGMSRD